MLDFDFSQASTLITFHFFISIGILIEQITHSKHNRKIEQKKNRRAVLLLRLLLQLNCTLHFIFAQFQEQIGPKNIETHWLDCARIIIIIESKPHIPFKITFRKKFEQIRRKIKITKQTVLATLVDGRNLVRWWFVQRD